MEGCSSFKALVGGTTLRLHGTSHQTYLDTTWKKLWCYVTRVGHNIIRPESTPPVRSPTPRQHHINTGYYYQLKDRNIFFVRDGGDSVGCLLVFKITRKMEERRAYQIWGRNHHVAWWLVYELGKESEGITVTRREISYYRLVLYQSPPTPFPTPPLLWSVKNKALSRL